MQQLLFLSVTQNKGGTSKNHLDVSVREKFSLWIKISNCVSEVWDAY
jgi:hypothetical protein